MAKKDKDTEVKQEVPKTPEVPVSTVRTFFTKELNDQIAGMSAKEMESLLKAMVSSREFIAILKYSSMRTPLLDATLRGTDPTKEPAKISWAQGAMAGLSDLESYIIDLNAPKVEPEEREEGEPAGGRPEGVIIG
jgi:hypothetical protein